jgi:hypothetical protein
MRTMSYTSFPTYTLTPVIQSALIHLSIYLFPSTPQYGLGNAVAGPVWPGRAVADPVGRVTPPQIGRGRRGCGRGGHHPPIRPGAAGWASGIPAGSPLPRGSFWPSPFFRSFTPRRFRYSPSGEASFPLSGESRGSALPPVGAEAPWAGNPG